MASGSRKLAVLLLVVADAGLAVVALSSVDRVGEASAQKTQPSDPVLAPLGLLVQVSLAGADAAGLG
jgi:hypothetical protein